MNARNGLEAADCGTMKPDARHLPVLWQPFGEAFSHFPVTPLA